MHHFPENFSIETKAALVECSATHDQTNREQLVITTTLPGASLQGNASLVIGGRELTGSVVDVGNPHFIIFDQTTPEWLMSNGKLIEQHERFPHKTNVEFVWQDKSQEKNTYNALVYERGCGITQACSSGAAAITWTLFEQQCCAIDKHIMLRMPGGAVTCWVDISNAVHLQASAYKIFDGILS
jgi:diaminopimelate epimerase